MSNVTPLKPAVPRGGDDDPRRRFSIDVNLHALPLMSDVAWKAIGKANQPPRYFSLGGKPVRLVPGTERRPAQAQEMTIDMMTRLSARTAFWHKYTEKDGMIEEFPVERVMRDMLADPDPPLPELRRITQAPMFGPQGTISTQPGYDPKSGHYFDPVTLKKVAPPSEAPTDAEVAGAVAFLRDELLHDFPFAEGADFANALSMTLNPFLRSMIDGPTPLYLIEAPTPGTGKGLLAEICMLPALGTRPTIFPPTANEDELRKKLMSVVMALPDAVMIDNLAEGLDSSTLSALLTAYPFWSDRVLGRSENRSVPVTATWIATGNNPSRSREMARRVVTIRLDAKEERPELRKDFKHPRLERWARAHRAELITACLTIVQGWVARGRCPSAHVMGSFDAWAETHGGVLESCGVEGFLANRARADAATISEDLQWTEFVNHWWGEHRDAVVGTDKLFPIALAMPEFPLGASPLERNQRMVLGRGLGQRIDRIFDGLQITYVKDFRRAAQYRLVWCRDEPQEDA